MGVARRAAAAGCRPETIELGRSGACANRHAAERARAWRSPRFRRPDVGRRRGRLRRHRDQPALRASRSAGSFAPGRTSAARRARRGVADPVDPDPHRHGQIHHGPDAGRQQG